MKKFVSVLSVFIVAFMVLTPVNVFSASSAVPPRVTKPHTPDLRPSQPHMRAPEQGIPVTGQVQSLNWAGHAVAGSKNCVIDVKGSWTVPSLTCSKQTAYLPSGLGLMGSAIAPLSRLAYKTPKWIEMTLLATFERVRQTNTFDLMP
jgi:hypothetical protein